MQAGVQPKNPGDSDNELEETEEETFFLIVHLLLHLQFAKFKHCKVNFLSCSWYVLLNLFVV